MHQFVHVYNQLPPPPEMEGKQQSFVRRDMKLDINSANDSEVYIQKQHESNAVSPFLFVAIFTGTSVQPCTVFLGRYHLQLFPNASVNVDTLTHWRY